MSEHDWLLPAVGAVLFASGEPVTSREIADAFELADAAPVEQAIAELAESYTAQRFGLQVEHIAGGVRLATRPDVGEWVRRFFRHRHRTRLSVAALETLAVVAYRQPVTAPEVQAIRGRDPAAALKNLLDKKLLRILGRKKVVGSPLLYGTSKEFLVHFGLNSLEDLPSIEEFEPFVESMGGVQALAVSAEPAPDVEPGAAESDSGWNA